MDTIYAHLQDDRYNLKDDHRNLKDDRCNLKDDRTGKPNVNWLRIKNNLAAKYCYLNLHCLV